MDLAIQLEKLYQPTHGAIPEDLLGSFKPHKISPEALSALQSTIENITEKSAIDQIRQIIQLYQILLSRTKALPSKPKLDTQIKIVTSYNIDVYIADCAKLYHCVSSLYPYSRNETDEVRGCFTDAHTYTALNLLGFHDMIHTRLYPKGRKNAEG
ncbi:hypothetical protein [Falsiroseomonas sp.]|uniref:hypothetical protein n=1 Tax=Falsiroseomonas sp. TaxID=2870721 RepID=UPI002732F557|nr:hypothetical protein [Falsiroseomonas sp.]MDP3418426.1 hypothetical protein [Falsiroseomonas sp.]